MDVRRIRLSRRRVSVAVASIAVLTATALIVACGSAGSRPTPTWRVTSPQETFVITATSSATAEPPSVPVAHSSVPHVMLILMENHSYSDIIGNGSAPYVNSLANSNGLATNWSDLSHPSLPNYLGLMSGSIWNNPQDTTPQDMSYPGPSFVDELAHAGIGWEAYMEDLNGPCSDGGGYYDVNHDPFMYFTSITSNPSQCNRVVPYTQLGSDLASNTAPPFLWVSPNLIHDMHDGSIAQGDAWLQSNLPTVFSSAWYRSGGVVIITWDEGEGSEQIPTIVVSATHSGHRILSAAGNHFGTLRALEEVYGVGFLGASDNTSNGDLRPLF
jgi:phosphatidylinositol-3-phosphatase